MQRILVHGIPYNVDSSNRLFCYDETAIPPIQIGTYNPATKSITLDSTKLPILQERVAVWRRSQAPRSRKPSTQTATAEEGDESTEESGDD